MRQDICYQDNETPARKRECDHKMLAELNVLVREGRRNKVDRQLVQSIIGLKHRMGLGIDSSNQLHKPVQRQFDKQVDDIWTAELVHIPSFSRSNKGYKYLLTVIDVFSKYGWIAPLKTKTGIEDVQAFRKFSSVRNGKIRADFYNDCQDIPDPSALDPTRKNLLLLDDCFLGKQNKAGWFYIRGRHNNCDTIYIAENYF